MLTQWPLGMQLLAECGHLASEAHFHDLIFISTCHFERKSESCLKVDF